MEEPILAVDQIQGNIIPGFRLPYQYMVACSVTGNSVVNEFLEWVLPQITTMKEALAYKEERLARAAALDMHGIASFSLPEKSCFSWLNIGFGNNFVNQFNTEATAIDPSFQTGMAGRSRLLGDSAEPDDEDNQKNWLFGNEQSPVDIFLVLGSDRKEELDNKWTALKQQLAECSIHIIYSELCERLEDDKEHFGFRDGISQPAVRGYIDNNHTFLYPREIVAGNDNPDSMEFAYPGKMLIWPGQFVFGYPRQSASHFRKPDTTVQSEFLKNGSFMVVRRLKQDVKTFETVTHQLHATLTTSSGYENVSYEDFVAQLVGRHKNGKPAIAGTADMAADAFNNFNFKTATNAFTLADGSIMPAIAADPDGSKCPMFAHIRKVNPRDLHTDQGAETNTATFRILRRGIPFGPPVSAPAADEQERGLLFISYQTSILNQFELLTSKWMNEDSRPETTVGFDMIVGQNNEEDAASLRWCIFGNTKRLETKAKFVIPTGGGYFFCPSIASIRKMIKE